MAADSFAEALTGFVFAQSWAVARQLVERHPQLLADAADETLSALASTFAQDGDEQQAALIRHRQGLLRRCREVGLDQAFAEWTADRVPFFVDADLAPLLGRAQVCLHRYEQTQSRADLEEALRHWAALLGHPRSGEMPAEVRRQVAAEAGMTYFRDYTQTGEAASFARASALLEEALSGYAPTSSRRPNTLYHLGALYCEGWRRTGHAELLDSAIEHCAEAIGTNDGDDLLDFGARLTLAQAAQAKHAQTGEPSLLRLAENALAGAPPAPDTRLMLEVTRLRTQVLLALHLQHDDPGAIDTAVSLREAALAALPHNTSQAQEASAALGVVLHLRFRARHQAADSDRALEVTRHAANSGAELETLAMLLTDRLAFEPGNRALLDELIDLRRRFLADPRADAAEHTLRLVEALALRYRESHDPGDLSAAQEALGRLGRTERVAGLLTFAAALEESPSPALRRADHDRAVDLVRQAGALAEPGSGAQARALIRLAILLMQDHQWHGRRVLAAEAIEAGRRALATAGLDAAERAECAVNHANTLLAVVVATGDGAALDEAALVLAEHRDGTGPAGTNGLSTWGRLLLQRYLLEGGKATLDEAIAALTRAADSTSEPGALIGRAIRLGNALHLRHGVTGDPADLDRAFAALEDLVEVVRPGDPQHEAHLPELRELMLALRRDADDPLARARYHWLRYETMSFPVDREHDLCLALDLLERVPRGHVPDEIGRMYDAAASFHNWAAATEGAAATGRAVELFRRIRRLADGRPEVWAAASDGLCGALTNLYWLTGSLDVMAEAITLARELTATGAADPAGRHPTLAGLLLQRYDRTGELGDLAEAIRVGQEAVAAATDADPALAPALNVLGNALKIRYRLAGDPADIDTAIAAGVRAMEQAHKDDPRLDSYLSNLASFHQERFERTGDMASLERAIELGRQARATSPLAAVVLGNLSYALEARHEMTGDRHSLDEAVEVARAAVAAAGPGDPDRGRFHSGLSVALRMRYRLAGDPQDLRGAIEAGRESLRDAAGHEALMDWQLMLALALRAEFLRSADGAALTEALHLSGEAAAAEAASGKAAVLARSNYASILLTRYDHTADLADLDRAIEVQRETLSGLDTQSVHNGSMHANLAIALQMRFRADPGAFDDKLLDETTGHLRAAARTGSATTSSRITAAVGWGSFAAQRHRWAEATDGYDSAIALLPRLANRALTRDGKEEQLAGIAGLAGDAAAAALNAGCRNLALEMLEHGRAILLAQQLETRQDTAELRAAFPGHADRFDTLRKALDPPPERR